MIRGTKRRITDGILHSEMLRLARLVPSGTGLTVEAAADALSEIIAAFPVYRSYLPEGADVLKEACELAVRRRPELADAVGHAAAAAARRRPGAGAELGRRFQQTSGMVMAKGVEDTAFFRYTRLGTLTEVGADPTEFSRGAGGVPPPDGPAAGRASAVHDHAEHARHQAQRGHPGPDLRARGAGPGMDGPPWPGCRSWRRCPTGRSPTCCGRPSPAPGPRTGNGCSPTRRRRPGRPATPPTGLDPDAGFEEKLAAAVDAAFDNPEVRAELESLVELLAPYGAVNSLAAKLVQLTMPGVPDVYQGTEFWDRSLTDPDNRRPFDFGARRTALAALDAGDRPASYTDDAAKLLVTSRALRLRRDRPELFTGYRPVAATGAAAGHLVGFDRGSAAGAGAVTLATRLPRGLEQQGGWRDTAVELAGAMTRRTDGRHLRPGRRGGGRHPGHATRWPCWYPPSTDRTTDRRKAVITLPATELTASTSGRRKRAP